MVKKNLSPSDKEQKNYMTPNGMKKIQEELSHLHKNERAKVVQVISWAASNGDRSENGDYIYGKKRLREIDHRIYYLTKQLNTAEVIDPASQSGNKVLFGATVTVQMENEEVKVFRIVGVEEADISVGKISWLSPLAQSMLSAKEGELVRYQSPQGEQEVEIIKVSFLAIE